MFGSELLDVAIGLGLVYLVLSLICSAACELIESQCKRRAILLHRGLREMLAGEMGSEILVQELYDHPLVSSLFRGKYRPSSTRNLPSYIPPANFALALMDIVGLGGTKDNVTASPVSSFSTVMPGSPEWLRTTIAVNLPSNPEVSRALLVLAFEADYDRERLQRNIEAWFGSTAERASGSFKQYSNMVVLALGLSLGFAINADTVALVNGFATGRAVRSSLVSAATEAAKRQLAGTAQAVVATSAFEADLERIRSSGLPLGWSQVPRTPREWYAKALGVFLTALAISLGAPFWFDTLNRVMAFRSLVKPKDAKEGDGGSGKTS